MRFSLNKPFETDQATVDVDPGLPSGTYRFRLEVVDNSGRRSNPAEVTVVVEPRLVIPPIDPTRPVPVVTPTPVIPTPVIPTPVIPIRGGNPT